MKLVCTYVVEKDEKSTVELREEVVTDRSAEDYALELSSEMALMPYLCIRNAYTKTIAIVKTENIRVVEVRAYELTE